MHHSQRHYPDQWRSIVHWLSPATLTAFADTFHGIENTLRAIHVFVMAQSFLAASWTIVRHIITVRVKIVGSVIRVSAFYSFYKVGHEITIVIRPISTTFSIESQPGGG